MADENMHSKSTRKSKKERSREKERLRKRKRSENDDIELAKHYEAFYEQPPPGIIKENDENPQDCIPDLPENRDAREFLAHAPAKGLWMPLGKEVKVMKCWRCKAYGHRTGDRECPLFISGNRSIEKFRMAHEDPMHEFIQDKKKAESKSRIEQLRALLEESTSESDSEESSEDSSSEEDKKKRNKRSKRKHRKKSKKKHKHKRQKLSKDYEKDSVSRKDPREKSEER
ncbi:retinitis pigmentosa 9 protein homolog [Montipora capricornis]|uniref:retinitis pigmentosa 9 protein homolog n=1 Tax=Montipora capricornis TaxID=246305 RepID=UPI0035F17B79